MRVYTDQPEKFANSVPDLSQADMVVGYSSDFLARLGEVHIPVYYVGRRAPLSVTRGVNIRVISESDAMVMAENRPVEGRSVVAGDHPRRLPLASPTVLEKKKVLESLYVSYSPDTRVGKTFIAGNLACWQALHGRRVVLLDLDTTVSDTWRMLHFKSYPPFTISTWKGGSVQNLPAANEHPAVPGLYILPHGGAATPIHVVRLAEALCGEGYTVIADMSNNIDLPHIASVLMLGGTVFLVGQLTRKAFGRIQEMMVNSDKYNVNGRLSLIINRVGSGDDDLSLVPEAMARQFPTDGWYVVHEDRRARESANKKKIFPVMVKKSKVKAELERIFTAEFKMSGGGYFTEEKKSGFLAQLFNRR